MFKKTISLLLSIVISFSFFGVLASAEDKNDLRVAVASDLHYNSPRAELTEECDDPIFWYANRRAAMEDESGFIIDAFLSECAADNSVDYVLISGDLTDSRSDVPQHEELAEKLRRFEEESGKDVYVINGNHDTGSGENDYSVDDFKSIYHDFGYDKALVIDDETASYTADLGEKYRLIALDSCDQHASTADGMSLSRVKWVKTQADAAKKDGRYPVLMMHHNLVDHLPVQRLLNHDFIVRFHYSTAELFSDWGIRVVLTGHEHCSDVSVFTGALGNKLYDLATTSLTMYPLSYRVISFTDDKIDYESRVLSGIDTDALSATVSGYTDEQLRLMDADINAFAKGFLKAGVQYRLELSLSDEKIGVDEGDIYYGLVHNATSSLVALLRAPLYGEDSVSERAQAYGIAIPESGYATGWDLATDLVARHYEGGEDVLPESPEVTILLRTVALILREELRGIPESVISGAAGSLLNGSSARFDNMNTALLKTFGGIGPVEYLAAAVASPLLYEFAFDSDGADDNNGSIEGYGVSGASYRLDNIGSKAGSVLRSLLTYIRYVLYYVSKIFVK